MKLLLDECVVQDFRHLVMGHDVFTAAYMRWSGVRNSELLKRAAAERFDALITTDRELEHQQNIEALPLAVIVLRAASNDLDDLKPLVPELLRVLGHLKAHAVTHVGA